MDEQQPAGVEKTGWNVSAIFGAMAGLAASLCFVGFFLAGRYSRDFYADRFMFYMVIFALVAIVFLFFSRASRQRRGGFQFGIVGAVLGVVVPIVFIWGLFSHMWA